MEKKEVHFSSFCFIPLFTFLFCPLLFLFVLFLFCPFLIFLPLPFIMFPSSSAFPFPFRFLPPSVHLSLSSCYSHSSCPPLIPPSLLPPSPPPPLIFPFLILPLPLLLPLFLPLIFLSLVISFFFFSSFFSNFSYMLIQHMLGVPKPESEINLVQFSACPRVSRGRYVPCSVARIGGRVRHFDPTIGVR